MGLPLRQQPWLSQAVFPRYRSETELLRYIQHLASQDLSLVHGMIPLGSCTMKLNAAAELAPVSWPSFGQLHPFAPAHQSGGYQRLASDLERWLAAITGFAGVSLQPNAGSQGEYAGLLAIRAWHRSRGEAHRRVCLIPTSAHGTNPATAVMVGLQVVAVACDDQGNIDLVDLEAKARAHADTLAALTFFIMVSSLFPLAIGPEPQTLRLLAGGRHITNNRPIDDNRDGRDENFKIAKAMPHFAALVRVAPQVSVYGSFSRSFQPQRQQTADLDAIRASQGDPTSPTYRPPASIPFRFLAADLLGKGREIGAKVDLKNGWLVGTTSYFVNEEANRLDVDTANQVLFQLPGATVRVAAGRTQTRGVESEWVWTPSARYQAMLSGSYFFKKNELSNPSEPREVGSHLESVPKYTATFWNKYTFPRGPLHGWYVGGGASLIGETHMHPSWTVPIKSDAVLLVESMVGYATKLGNIPANFRLNVRNLTDEYYLNGTFQYGEPRTFLASVGLRL